MTGFDYADQRFYASSYGRFNTADSFSGSASGQNPGSWNRYAYVGGDPINNNNDPTGMCAVTTYSSDGNGNIVVDCADYSGDGIGGGGGGPHLTPLQPPESDPGPSVPVIPCSSLLVSAITGFLTSNNSPLLSQDPQFISQVMKAAAAAGVDPRLFIAETEESGLGTSNVARTMDNPFGLKLKNINTDYSSAGNAVAGVGNAVVDEGRTLNTFVNVYGETVSQMYSGSPWPYGSEGLELGKTPGLLPRLSLSELRNGCRQCSQVDGR